MNNLFSEDFTFHLGRNTFNEKFVNDVIDNNEFLRWKGQDKESLDWKLQTGGFPFATPLMPVFVNAPTGSGKNYFVLHNLRIHALRCGQRIIYISNRVALDAQMRKELAEITGVESRSDKEFILDEYTEDFGNITVTTYQKVAKEFFKRHYPLALPRYSPYPFDYVVLDEAHFFVADALFNPHTGYLLDALVFTFYNCTRIYMSATFEEVLAPICHSEQKFFERYFTSERTQEAYDKYRSADVLRNRVGCYVDVMEQGRFAYRFNRDFSSYQPHFFNDLKEIEDAIASDYLGKAKWIIFVNSRDEGIQLVRKLNSEFKKYCDEKVKELKNATGNSATSIEVEVKKPYQDFAVFIDRYSRHKDDVSGEIWRKLINTGVLPCKVLVATSVLDIRFSIKDDNVKNIVICTDDKVEFLQELGRRRILSDQDSVELYIRKVTPASLNVRKRYLERQLDFYKIAYGGLQIPEDEKKNPQLALAVKTICNHYGYNDFEYLTFTMKSSNELEIHANYFARRKIICLKREIERYEELVAQYGQEAASVIYKAEWIDLDSARAVQISELGSAPMVDLIDFLEEYVSSESNLYLSDHSFEIFSRAFQELFHSAFPEEKINSGKNRDYWKAEAIRNHLNKINGSLKSSAKYILETVSASKNEKCYRLERR